MASRRQRDIAFLPGQAHAQHILLPGKFAVAHHAVIGDRAGIRAGERSGQREAGHFQSLGQAMQVFFLLLLRAVVQQQFGRPQGIRHHHRHRRRAAARSHFAHHCRMRLRGKFQPAITLRNDHAEETLVLDELPDIRGQIGAIVRDVPIVQHRAQLLDFIVEECLLPGAQSAFRKCQQFVPIGVAAEQFAIPPHRAGIDRFLFRGGDLREDFAEYLERSGAHHIAAQVGYAEEHDEQQQHAANHHQHVVRKARLYRDHRQNHHRRQHPTGDRGPEEREHDDDRQRDQKD